MALINCPECKKQVSDKAKNCPHCGYPIDNMETVAVNLNCPAFPDDLSIGKQIVNWTYDAVIDGIYENSKNPEDIIPSGKIKILLFTNGLKITKNIFFEPIIQIHYSQIISVSEIRGSQLKDKSVIGRAVVGNIVFGPLGAIIGGISGIGNKSINSYMLIINYWDVAARTPKTISLMCSTSAARFIKRLNKERDSVLANIEQEPVGEQEVSYINATETEKMFINTMRNNKKRPDLKDKTDEELLKIIRDVLKK